jgi:hypothetical protein
MCAECQDRRHVKLGRDKDTLVLLRENIVAIAFADISPHQLLLLHYFWGSSLA